MTQRGYVYSTVPIEDAGKEIMFNGKKPNQNEVLEVVVPVV